MIDLDIQPSDRPANDDFSAGTDLGQALDTLVTGTTANATMEVGETLTSGGRSATVWWAWTAPATGSYAVEIEQGRPSAAIFTGSALDALTSVVTSYSQTLVPFAAQAGVTYRISLSIEPTAAGPLAFTIRGNPPPNDAFANRIVLDSALPLAFGGRTSLATLEIGEPRIAGAFTGRTIWWQWTAPADGAVNLIAPLGAAGSAHLFTGDTLTFLQSMPVTTPATGVQRFLATAGTPYIIGFSATTSTSGAIPAALELRPARTPPPNDRFADAIALSGESAASTSHNWGAGVDPGEPLEHTRTLWWTWTAPRNGSARIAASHGVLHLYRGDSPAALIPAGNPYSTANLYPVSAGDTFRIAVSTQADPLDVSLSVEMTPLGDDFHAPIFLPSIAPPAMAVDLARMGWEPLEPPHNGKPAEHSAWFRWTAPDQTSATFTQTPATGTRIAVYQGEALTSLTPVAEGAGTVTFLPQAGAIYHIVIDHDPGTSPGSVTLALAPQLTGYAAWRAARFPEPNSPTADPDADPDGDGRVNLLEMALATDPLAADVTPNPVRIRDFLGHVTLSVVRPVGVDGLVYAFEVSQEFDQPWRSSKSMDRLEWTTPLGDGMEEFHTLLIPLKTAGHPRYFARLLVEIK